MILYDGCVQISGMWTALLELIMSSMPGYGDLREHRGRDILQFCGPPDFPRLIKLQLLAQGHFPNSLSSIINGI